MSAIAYRYFLEDSKNKLQNLMSSETLEATIDVLQDVLLGYDMQKIISLAESKEDYLNDYLDAITVEGKSAKTVIHYKYVLNHLMKYLNIPAVSITAAHIRKFFSAEKERGISDRTLRGYQDVFNSYFGWLFREELIARNPVENISRIKYKKKVLKSYSETDLEKLKRACGDNKAVKALVYFLYASGCRIGEVVSLNRDDINLEKEQCIVLGKGNKERTVYIDPVTTMIMKEYLESRNDDCPALFISHLKKRLTANGARVQLKKLEKECNIEHVHPHKFRRTRATVLIKHGMSIEEVAAILGHERLDTTMQYILLDNGDIEHSYRKFA